MAKKLTQTFGSNSYPSEMRRQLWALCCGASIISGFKHAANLSEDAIVAEINDCLEQVPDMQVFGGEQINPKLTFLTLNSGQMSSAKIMSAIKTAGFVQIATGRPRGSDQGFFVRDASKTLRLINTGAFEVVDQTAAITDTDVEAKVEAEVVGA